MVTLWDFLYDPDMILSFVYRLHNLDIKVISLADTIGTAPRTYRN